MFFSILVATPIASAQQGGNGLQMSPTRTEISANPGEVKNFSLTLKNITQGDFTAKAVINDFESDNVSGTPKILVNSNDRTPYSISTMLKGLSDVELKAGETKEVKLSVDVPGNASPGAYFGAVRFSVTPKANATSNERQIALNASVAHLVFVEVPGNVTQQIKVESLKFQNGDKSGRFFVTKKPDKSAVAVKNLGNGFSRPFGKVTVKGPFGKQAHTYEVNNVDPRSIVLPNSSRTFTDELKGVKLPGKYSATASVAYGNGGEVVNFKSSFWYLPIWFLIVLFILIAGIIGGGYYAYRKYFGPNSLVKKPKAKKIKK